MHELALEQRRDLGTRAPWHVGDVTWGLRQHEGREDEWTFRVWKDAKSTVAWSWLKGDRGLLEFDVRRDRVDLLDEIYGRRCSEEGGRQAIVYCVSSPACALYEAIGFRRHASVVGYSR
jgi:hypothetical protein